MGKCAELMVTHCCGRALHFCRTIVHRREEQAEAGQLAQGDVIGRGENVDPQADYGYEEHLARSEEKRRAGPSGVPWKACTASHMGGCPYARAASFGKGERCQGNEVHGRT